MCDCCRCFSLPVSFQEISKSTKPCISLNNLSDANNLLVVLQVAKLVEGLCIIDGCDAATICGSISDMLQWRRNHETAPTPDLAAIVDILIPSLDNFQAP
jgi:hypothetical protein